jgi:hypothetical protein
MLKQTRIAWRILVITSTLILVGCLSRPTGFSGTVKVSPGTDPGDLELHVVELKQQNAQVAMPIFVEGDTVATPPIDAQGHFEMQIRPGAYMLKLFSAQGDLLTNHRISVKRNKMTQVRLLKE